MSNILADEYTAIISRVAAKWGADGGADASWRKPPTWTARLGSVSAEIALVSGPQRWSRVPVARTTSSGGVPRDAACALAVTQEQSRMLHLVLAAYTEVAHLTVWHQDCPCDYCGAKGKTSGRPCEDCNGTGKRQSTTEDPDEGRS